MSAFSLHFHFSTVMAVGPACDVCAKSYYLEQLQESGKGQEILGVCFCEPQIASTCVLGSRAVLILLSCSLRLLKTQALQGLHRLLLGLLNSRLEVVSDISEALPPPTLRFSRRSAGGAGGFLKACLLPDLLALLQATSLAPS
jgi:hypothetical protein